MNLRNRNRGFKNWVVIQHPLLDEQACRECHPVFRKFDVRRLILDKVDHTPQQGKLIGGRLAVPLNDFRDIGKNGGGHGWVLKHKSGKVGFRGIP